MSSEPLTRRQRQWYMRCESAIRQGGGRLNEALGDTQGITPSPSCWTQLVWFVSQKVSKPSSALRMATTILDHSNFPELPAEEAAYTLRRLIEKETSISILPLLHAKGWRLGNEFQDFDCIATTITQGKWPHVELIFPQLFHNKEFHDKVALGLTRKEFLLNTSAAQAACQLQAPAAFKNTLSISMGINLPREIAPMSVRHKGMVAKILATLSKSGFLNLDTVRLEARHYDATPATTLLLDEVDAKILAINTPAARAPARSRRI